MLEEEKITKARDRATTIKTHIERLYVLNKQKYEHLSKSFSNGIYFFPQYFESITHVNRLGKIMLIKSYLNQTHIPNHNNFEWFLQRLNRMRHRVSVKNAKSRKETTNYIAKFNQSRRIANDSTEDTVFASGGCEKENKNRRRILCSIQNQVISNENTTIESIQFIISKQNQYMKINDRNFVPGKLY